MAAEQESRMDESWRISRDVAIRQRDEARAELKAAQELLLECHGWMAGIDPKPAPPFLDAVLAAAQRTEEPNA